MKKNILRAMIEVGFIIFLFYSNLLMGEFERSGLEPNNADLHDLLSQAYLFKGMEKEAEEENERALQLADEKDLLAEHIGVYRRGGFQAVSSGDSLGSSKELPTNTSHQWFSRLRM